MVVVPHPERFTVSCADYAYSECVYNRYRKNQQRHEQLKATGRITAEIGCHNRHGSYKITKKMAAAVAHIPAEAAAKDVTRNCWFRAAVKAKNTMAIPAVPDNRPSILSKKFIAFMMKTNHKIDKGMVTA